MKLELLNISFHIFYKKHITQIKHFLTTLSVDPICLSSRNI